MNDLIRLLGELKISIKADNGQLKISDPGNKLTAEVLERVREKKAELLKLMEGINPDYRFEEIESAAGYSSYPLSSNQLRLFLINQYAPLSVAYNMPVAYRINGELNKQKLKECFQLLVDGHDSLRISFRMVDGVPYQYIKEKEILAINEYSISAQDIAWQLEDFVRPFDLSHDPLIRISLATIALHDYLLLIDMHHIVSDGVSQAILVEQLMALYSGMPLTAPGVQYRDYIVWKQSKDQEEQLLRQKSYWMEVLSGELPLLNLPLDFPRPSIRSDEGASVTCRIGREVMDRAKQLANAEGASLYMILLSAFNILLYKLSGQEDIIIGIPAAGRRHVDVENVVGMFVNSLPLRNKVNGWYVYREFLKEIKAGTLQALDNQDYPYAHMIEDLKLNRDMSRNPLFDVMFVLQNIKLRELRIPGLELAPYPYNRNTSKFDLTVIAEEQNDELILTIEYAVRVFKRETAERIGAYFINLLSALIENPERRISDLGLLSTEEREQLLYDFNNTERDYRRNVTIHGLFEEQVLKTPDAIAIHNYEEEISYRELNERANQLAHFLIGLNLSPNSYIPVLIDRSVEMIIALMGILKSGNAYVPVEPELPSHRVLSILESVNPDVVITTSGYFDKIPLVPGKSYKKVSLDRDSRTLSGKTKNPELYISSHADAYVIFTSGSTGKPKGVLVKHRPVINLVEWVNQTFQVGIKDKILFTASYSFDLSVYDIFGLLAAGGAVQIVSNTDIRNPEKLLDMIIKDDITFWDSVPGVLQQLVPFMHRAGSSQVEPSLRLAFLSGDWIPLSLPGEVVKHFRKLQVIALGGATEATIWSNYFKIGEVQPEWKSIPYGQPIQNARYYILDDFMNVCPLNVPGNLYIGGECLASGYINDEELTGSKFFDNPFVNGEKIYKTGDLAKWKHDGYMEFLGRKDFQVKIRGFRIELGDIEHNLRKHKDVREVFVTDRQDKNGHKYLCAYIVTNGKVNTQALRDFLGERLPHYMIPSFFVEIENMPLTSNGKINRSDFPDPKILLSEISQYEEPVNEVEYLLKEVWEQVLNYSPVGRNAGFFEIGGDSVKAVQVSARFFSKGYKVEVADIFRNPVMAQLATCAKKVPPEPVPGIEQDMQPVEEELNWLHKRHLFEDIYPLSPVQKGIYYHWIRDRNIRPYQIQQSFRVHEVWDIQRFKEGLEQVHEKYAILRANVVETNSGKPYLVIAPYKQVDFTYHAVKPGEDFDQVVAAFKAWDIGEPFDLLKSNLIRVVIVQHKKDEFELIFSYHEIILDGWSLYLLFEEMMKAYSGEPGVKPEEAVPYKDFIKWIYKKDITAAGRYWLSCMEGYDKECNIFDYQPVGGPDKDKVNFVSITLPEVTFEKLFQYAKQQQSTINFIVQAIWGAILCKYFGTNDIVYSIGMSLRPNEILHVENIIGKMFNVVPVRIRYNPEDTFKDILNDLKEQFIEGLPYCYYPLSQIKADNKFYRGVFDHSLIFNNFPRYISKDLSGIDIKPSHGFSNNSFDINVDLHDTLTIGFRYKEKWHNKSKLDKWMADFNTAFHQVTAVEDLLFKNLIQPSVLQKEHLIRNFNEHL